MIALGGANFSSFTQAAIICDAYFERGGNVLDSAWVYGNGLCDELLGAWMAARGVRDDIILIGKGANAPLTYPDVIGPPADRIPRPPADRPSSTSTSCIATTPTCRSANSSMR